MTKNTSFLPSRGALIFFLILSNLKGYAALDAGVTAIDSPSRAFCGTSSQHVYISFFNYGTSTITTATIGWSVNGVKQASYKWSGSLKSSGKAQVNIGNILFKNKDIISSWVDTVNSAVLSRVDTATITLKGGLNGTYTIDKSAKGSPDYVSFQSAASALDTFGICGAVTFNVADGSYFESISLTAISGSSAANTITFQSKSLDSTKVILYSYDKGNIYPGFTFGLIGSQYIRIREMTIANKVSDFGYTIDGIFLTEGASHNIFENNIITIYTTQHGGGGAAIYADVSKTEKHNIIRHNVLTGGQCGVFFENNDTTVRAIGNMVIDNLIDSSWEYGVFFDRQDSSFIIGNKIRTRGFFYGILIDNHGNKDSQLVANNFIYGSNDFGTGIYLDNTDKVNCYFNSISCIGSNGASCIKTDIISGINHIFNNIFYADDRAEPASLNFAKGTLVMDYNNYYKSIGSFSLSNWQTTFAQDKYSTSGDPFFADTSKGDLHLAKFSSAVQRAGIPRYGVTNDIDGESRNAKYPTIGADEKVFPHNDIALNAILSPLDSLCGDTNSKVIVQITNRDVVDLDSDFTIHIDISGAKLYSDSIKFHGKVKALSDTSLYVPTHPAFNTASGGNYKITAWTHLNTDIDHSNDTAWKNVRFYPLPDAHFKVIIYSNFKVQFFARDTISNYHSWDFGDSSTGAGKSPVHYYSGGGSFDVSLTTKNSYGCKASRDTVINPVVTNVEERISGIDANVSIYPNPATGLIHIESTGNISLPEKIELYDIEGRLIKSYNTRSNSFGIDVSSLPKGFYTIRIQSEKGIIIKHFVIE